MLTPVKWFEFHSRRVEVEYARLGNGEPPLESTAPRTLISPPRDLPSFRSFDDEEQEVPSEVGKEGEVGRTSGESAFAGAAPVTSPDDRWAQWGTDGGAGLQSPGSNRPARLLRAAWQDPPGERLGIECGCPG
ncbi:unnamed protein product [Lampetra planeri]